jgi:UDP-N-acetylmuramyl tripeptide synthase
VEVTVTLAKNPAGVAALLDATTGHGDVIVAINDLVADGHDPSWIYDAPFERLRGRTVWCDGRRALDLAVRLEVAGVTWRLARDHTTFPAEVVADGPVQVIANYTAFTEWSRRGVPA